MPKKRAAQAAKVITLRFDDNRLARDLFGAEDRNLRALGDRLGLDIAVRGADLRIKGPSGEAETGEKILNQLYRMLKRGCPITGSDIEQAISALMRDRGADLESLFSSTIFLPAKKRAIVPRSAGQREYMEKMSLHDVVFSIGPAGTGKTYLAVAVGIAALLKKEFDRMILTRPAVEAGERLGFLPGDMIEKINPYLRPLYDALHDMLEPEKVHDLMEDDRIEVAPIAFMRGRTLHRAFIILDEAQNLSCQQMKMCLTRLGVGSRMIINGDVTQIDLPAGQVSGLLDAWRILDGRRGFAFHEFTEADVVRHKLVCDIISAYRQDEGKDG